jgi:hypothetical protein
MTPPVIAAPIVGRYAPCGLASATPPVPLSHPVFVSFQRKAGRK